MCAFRDLKEPAEARGRLAKEPPWQAFLVKSIAGVAHMLAIVLMPAPFSAMRCPKRIARGESGGPAEVRGRGRAGAISRPPLMVDKGE